MVRFLTFLAYKRSLAVVPRLRVAMRMEWVVPPLTAIVGRARLPGMV